MFRSKLKEMTVWQCVRTWPVEIGKLIFLADLGQECERTTEIEVNSDDETPNEELHPLQRSPLIVWLLTP